MQTNDYVEEVDNTTEEVIEVEETPEEPTEETIDTTTTEEEVDEETVQEDENDDEAQQKLKRATRQIQKLKKELKERPNSNNSEYEELALAAYGYKDTWEQDQWRELSKKAGMPVTQAIKDEDLQALYDARKRKFQARAAPGRPNSRAATTKKDVDYYIQRDELPTDPQMIVAVQDEVIRRSKSRF